MLDIPPAFHRSMVLLAMPGEFSQVVLQQVLSTLRPRCLVVPAPPATVTHQVIRAPAFFSSTPSVVDVALRHDIPVLALARWRDLLAWLQPTTWLVTACYPRRVPAWVRNQVQYALNIHPSALPAWRGPDPLFYVARGDAEPAVTLHIMDDDYDTGPIVAQQHIATWDWHDEAELIRVHAHIGAELLLASWHGAWHAHPQALLEHRYAREPSASDYTLQPTWSQSRVRQFVAGTHLRNHPYYVPLQRCWVDALGVGAVPIVCSDGVCYGRARES
jgi:methionyl-tRNA formyltransferase